jgi:dihydroorotase
MNPPLRGEADRLALIEGVVDGTVDMIATDHAPHSDEEKSRGLAGSAFGIVGIETAFPLMYTHFVKTGVISMERLTDLLCYNARERFGLPMGDSFSVWDLNCEYKIDPEKFYSKGKATPFEGSSVFGKHLVTVKDGRIIEL